MPKRGRPTERGGGGGKDDGTRTLPSTEVDSIFPSFPSSASTTATVKAKLTLSKLYHAGYLPPCAAPLAITKSEATGMCALLRSRSPKQKEKAEGKEPVEGGPVKTEKEKKDTKRIPCDNTPPAATTAVIRPEKEPTGGYPMGQAELDLLDRQVDVLKGFLNSLESLLQSVGMAPPPPATNDDSRARPSPLSLPLSAIEGKYHQSSQLSASFPTQSPCSPHALTAAAGGRGRNTGKKEEGGVPLVWIVGLLYGPRTRDELLRCWRCNNTSGADGDAGDTDGTDAAGQRGGSAYGRQETVAVAKVPVAHLQRITQRLSSRLFKFSC